MMGRRVNASYQAEKFRSMLRKMMREEMASMGEHKLAGVVDYISGSGNKYFADVFLNGNTPKFQDAFGTFNSWTSVAGSFSVSGGIATSAGTANDTAIVTGSSYVDQTFICEVSMPAISSTQEAEIIIRYQDANNYYALVFANNVILLRKLSAGTATTLASISVSFSANTFYWLRIQAQGSRLTGWTSTTGAYGSWTNQIQATDSAFSKGSIGIRDVSLAAQYKLPTLYTGVTPAIPIRPGVGASLGIGQEVWVERVNFSSQDLLVDMPRVI